MEASELARELGKTVAQRRHGLGLSQLDLASLAGVSVRTLSSLERGKATVRLDILVAVLDVLGLELSAEIRRPG
jgi:y4mF family transcriptional regulator